MNERGIFGQAFNNPFVLNFVDRVIKDNRIAQICIVDQSEVYRLKSDPRRLIV